MRFDPHPFQKEGIRRGVSQATMAYLWDPGLGKTVTLLSVFSILQKKGHNRKMLVIAPLRVCHQVWPVQADLWDHLRHLKVVVLWGPDKDDLLRSDADVYVINPEGLAWLSRAIGRAFKEWPWDVLCVDESTRFKHPRTDRYRYLRPMLRMFRRRYILTGSPAPNGLIDLWGQIFILDGGHALGPTIGWYESQFFQKQQYGWSLLPDSAEKIYDRIKPLAMRLDAADHLDLPPLIENKVEVTLPEKAMKTYRQMEEVLITVLEEKVFSAANASVAWGKCRQIANGGLFHEDGETWTHIHEAKVDAVEEILEERQGKPCLVAYEYRHDLDRLRRRLGSDTPYIGGGVPVREFRRIEAAWNQGDLPVLLAQPQSVAHGLNLQGTAACVIDAGLTPDLEVDEQFVRRVWRQGQKETVIRHRIVAKDTVDEAIMGMLRKKDRTQRALLDALKDHFKGRRAA